MREILVFHIFSSHTPIAKHNVTLSFIESWTHPTAVAGVVIVDVAVVVHIPRVVAVIRICKPIVSSNPNDTINRSLRVLPYINNLLQVY